MRGDRNNYRLRHYLYRSSFYALILGASFAFFLTPYESQAAVSLATQERTTSNYTIPYNTAINLARSGDTTTALTILYQLRQQNPDDPAIARDYLVVSQWAGHDADVIKTYESLRPGPQPDYVLESVGRAYRSSGQPQKSLDIYAKGLAQSPKNEGFAAGIIRSLADLKRDDESLNFANKNLNIYGERLDVLLAAVYAAEKANIAVEALRYADRALKLAPQNAAARHDFIESLDFMGAPQLALHAIDQSPGVMTQGEYRRIQGDAAAQAVRWGPIDTPTDAERFVATDRAIANLDNLIQQWSQQGPAAQDNIVRARFDRIIAYRDRSRMQDVISEYKDLSRQGVTFPPYVLEAVGDAYLYLRHPEKARDMYEKVLATDPTNFSASLQLFYAYVDLDDFDSAYKQIDVLNSSQAIWIRLKGLAYPLPNPSHDATELAAAKARIYGEELEDANTRMSKIIDAAPNNSTYRGALANLYEARGWPRQAQEQYQIGLQIAQQHDPSLEGGKADLYAGEARTDISLQNFPQADGEVASVVRQYPENEEVQELDREWRAHNMAELRITAEDSIDSGASVQGGSGFGVDTELFSPPIDYNWRAFVGQYFAQESEPAGEGIAFYRQSYAGAEYRKGDLTADAALTYNHFDGNTDQRFGLKTDVDYTLNDLWSLAGTAELFSRDVPLRALNRGITANNYSVGAVYRESESREVTLTGDLMQFSDTNVRTGVTGTYTERLYTTPHFTIDSVNELAESQDSLTNQGAIYFNPVTDLLATTGLDFTQILYRRYDFTYDHHLLVYPGAYWQQDYGVGTVVGVAYQQRLHFNERLDLDFGASFQRRPYDAQTENEVVFATDLVWRFLP